MTWIYLILLLPLIGISVATIKYGMKDFRENQEKKRKIKKLKNIFNRYSEYIIDFYSDELSKMDLNEWEKKSYIPMGFTSRSTQVVKVGSFSLRWSLGGDNRLYNRLIVMDRLRRQFEIDCKYWQLEKTPEVLKNFIDKLIENYGEELKSPIREERLEKLLSTDS